jgi:mono/diheme cytochrome c family protein
MRTIAGVLVTFAAVGTAYAQDPIERGRYMIITGHCNNCHTAGYAAKEGKMPEKNWLMGSGALGYRGPWGTNYASNLRLTVSNLTEDAWVHYTKTFKARPPMPFWSVNETSEADLRAMYRYIKGLGPVGEPARASLPPGEDPKGPYVLWPTLRN